MFSIEIVFCIVYTTILWLLSQKKSRWHYSSLLLFIANHTYFLVSNFAKYSPDTNHSAHNEWFIYIYISVCVFALAKSFVFFFLIPRLLPILHIFSSTNKIVCRFFCVHFIILRSHIYLYWHLPWKQFKNRTNVCSRKIYTCRKMQPGK